MTTKTRAPFEITKSGEVFASDDGMDLFNNYKSEDLPPPDSVDVELDPLTGEVSVIEYGYEDPSDILQEEMDPASGAAPPGIGSYPSPHSHQSAQGPVEMPDYLSADTNANYDEDFEKYKLILSKAFESQRDKEIKHNGFLKLRALYSTLSKGWENNSQIEHIVKQTHNLIEIYKDAEFLDAASKVLLAFDPTLPNTRILNKSQYWIQKIHEISRERITTFQKSAGDGHYYISGIVSDTSVDRDGDRFTYSALKQMEQAINEGAPLFQNHNHDISDTLGAPVHAEVRGDESHAELWAEFRLEHPDYNPNVKNLIHKLETGERLGFSIGGDGGPYGFTFEHHSDGTDGRVIPHLSLYEVSVVGIPSNSHSYIMGHVFKSVRPNPNLNFN